MKIALIDDKEFGILQIKNALPRPDISVTYFDSVNTFFEQKEFFDFIFLDFFLEKDGITGDTVAEKVHTFCDVLIGFSSCEKGNARMIKKGAGYAFEKQWDEKNEALEIFFLEII